MKEKLKNKKVVYTIIGIVSVLLVMIAVTYAYWLVTKTQTGENEISSACLDISISGEENDITLFNQFPMSDEDGMKLVPYEFTVTNNCNTSVDYQVALESIGDSANELKGTSLKVALNDSYKLYSAYPSVETTISGAYESKKLGMGTLTSSGTEGSSATHELRIWIDKDAPISEMNKTFTSKISVTIGQGIEAPIIKEGTLAYSILSNVGGNNATSEIDPAYAHKTTSSGSLYIPISSYYGTEFTYDKTTKKYKLSGSLIQATLSECRNGTKSCGKYTLNHTSSTYESTKLYEVTDFQSSGYYVTANTINYVNGFSKVTTASEAGLYKTQDDLGDSYYFRGAPTNNYVEFGTYAEDTTLTVYDYNNWEEKTIEVKAGDPMYWRIVRINGDGTIRLVYNGTEKAANGVAHTATIQATAYYTNYNNVKYAGYTFDDGNGTQVDSTIKGVLDTWYDTHLEANYGTYIADSIFCNDREITSYYDYDNKITTTTKPTSGDYDIYYGAYDRINTYNTPSLKCTNKTDRYTVDDTTNGNGLLSNPVGLITIDEEVFAGAATGEKNTSYYLYSNEAYWTSAPAGWTDGVWVNVWWVDSGTLASYGPVYLEYGVRPVINLKADVKFTGDGSYETPYKIVME